MQELDTSDVLIVVPCLNEEAHLSELLAWLRRTCPAARIVVADGGSTDRSAAIVTQAQSIAPNIHLLDNPRRIQSAGVNLAVRRFGRDCRWLVRIDAHCEYPETYVADLLAAATTRHATSVVVPMVTKGRACFQRGVAAAQNSVLGTGGSAHRHVTQGRFIDHGHHALFDLDLFRRVGGYDESFSHNEDAELDQRLLAAGGRIWLEPGAAITYFPRKAIRPLFRQYRGYGAGRARTLRRHAARIKPRQLIPLAVAPALLLAAVSLPLAAWSPWSLLLALPLLGWAGLCLAFGTMLAIRARSVCILASGPAAMTMHAAWALGFLKERLLTPPPQPAPPPMSIAKRA